MNHDTVFGYTAISAIDTDTLLGVERYLLPRAANGEYEAVSTLLFILSEAIRQAAPLTPKLSLFLAGALREIADGGDPQKALKIRRKRGEKDTRIAVRKNVELAYFVADFRRKHAGQKISVEDAIAEVAENRGVPEETVKAAWRDYRNNVELREGGALLRFEKFTKSKE